MKIKSILLNIILLVFPIGTTFVQESTIVVIDSSQVIEKSFSKTLSEKYTGNEYNYDVAEGEAQNYLLRAINWFFKKLNDIFGIEIDPGMYKLFETLIYIILIAIALYIIIRLLVGHKATSFFSRKSKELAPLSFEEEHIERINLDELIQNALLQKDFRLAIRYMFLKILKELSIRNLINWHSEKTNIDYYKELKSEALQNNFSSVSYLYEHIWYGEFDLDELGFVHAKKDFDKLKTTINRHG